jgi:hypothetical protein
MRTRFKLAAFVLAMIGAQFSPLATAELISIVEFYNTDLKHYVLITDPDEVTAIENGAAGPGWERTGGSLMAYSSATDVAGLVPVCRFYGNTAAGGPNSHFFTADPAECAFVRLDPGWRFEGIAFYVLLAGTTLSAEGGPMARKASVTLRPVHRAYNNGFRPGQPNNGNHRFSTSQQAITSLTNQGWTDEGVVFVVPGSTEPGAALSGGCLIPKPGFKGDYTSPGSPVTQQIETFGTPAAPTVQVTTQRPPITLISRTSYGLSAGQNGRQVMHWDLTHNEASGPGVLIREDVSMPQTLLLPMRPQEVQTNAGAVAGSHTITTAAFSCSSPMTGSYFTSYRFLGLQTVTVPSGTYGACTFIYRQVVSTHITCEAGFGSGDADDTTVLWYNENLGLIGSSGTPNTPGSELSNVIRVP